MVRATLLLMIVLGLADACSSGEKHLVGDVKEPLDYTDGDSVGDQAQPEDVQSEGTGLDAVDPDLSPDVTPDLSPDLDPGDDVAQDHQGPETAVGYTVHEWGVLSLERSATAPTLYQSMDDKPVLYFYSQEPLTVDVSVTFTRGTGRETWPEIPLDSTLTWNGLEIGAGPCQEWADFPAFGEGQCPSPWEEPCEATFLGDYVVPDASCVTFGETVSPLLFYAGTNLDPVMPVTGSYEEAMNSEVPMVEVSFTTHMRFVDKLFVVYRDITAPAGWDQPVTSAAQFAAAMVDVASLQPPVDYTVYLTLQDVDFSVKTPEAADYTGLVNMLMSALTEQGLTAEEADAFAVAWAPMFFGVYARNGHPRIPAGPSVWVIGIHDQGDFDELMPLTLTPGPESLTRVLVSYSPLD